MKGRTFKSGISLVTIDNGQRTTDFLASPELRIHGESELRSFFGLRFTFYRLRVNETTRLRVLFVESRRTKDGSPIPFVICLKSFVGRSPLLKAFSRLFGEAKTP